MHLVPISCTDAIAEKLMKICQKNYSDDSAPFYMTQLIIFDLQTPSPVTKQTAQAALELFIENLPNDIFRQHFNPAFFENGKIKGSYCSEYEAAYFEKDLEAWLTSYKSQVRSPIRKEAYPAFISELYQYLGNPKFFFSANGLFVTPNYFCDNINVFILTQNHGKFPVDKLAMFSFFSPD